MQIMEETEFFIVKNTNFDVRTWRKNPKKNSLLLPIARTSITQESRSGDVAIKKLSFDGDGPGWESGSMGQGREPSRSSPCRRSP
jgi:hypothetical protein